MPNPSVHSEVGRIVQCRTEQDVVESAVPEGNSELKPKDIETLTPRQHVVYEVIAAADKISPGELYESYRERVDHPKTKRTIRTYRSKLEQYNLIRAEGQKRGRRYRLAARAPEP